LTSFPFRRFPQLDGLRGLAILLVVVEHTLYFRCGVHTDLGKLGVALFFVLSGFLITGLLDSELRHTGSVSLSAFYIRRGLRLFPALFVFLGIACLLIEKKVVTDTPWYAVGACLLYVRNIWGRGSATAHIWSLSLEEQFYACWPCIMRLFNRNVALRVAIGGVAAITAFRMTAIRLNLFDYKSGVFYERSWFRFDSLLIGCIFALCVLQTKYVGRWWAVVSSPVAPLVLWPCALAWTIWGEATSHVWYLTVEMGLATLIVVNSVLSKESRYLALLSHPVSRWVGRISYSWYLWQQLFIVTAFAGSRLPTLPLLASSLVLAVVSYHVVEKPFLKLKERLGQANSGRPRTCEVAA
jgi:peptidoglycan/LPS O-acetylase OafA/YrhL